MRLLVDIHGLRSIVILSPLWTRGSQCRSPWPTSWRQKMRIHRPATGPRHYRTVDHRFQAAKSRPQANLREEDKGCRCPGYMYPGSWCSSLIGGGREPAKAAQSKRHQGHGEGKGCSCGRASQRCHENPSTGIFGSSIMATSLFPLPFPRRHQGMMHTASPLTSSALDVHPSKALPGTRQGPSLCWEGRKKGLSPLRGGKLWSEDISPSRKKVEYERRLGICPKGQDLQARGEHIPRGDLLSPPGTARRKSTAADL
jgi:hypothetical protein